MSRKILLILSYFGIVNLLILTLILYSLYLLNLGRPQTSYLANSSVSTQYKALPTLNSQTAVSLNSQDARIDVLRDFFKKYNSPLLSHAQFIIDTADKYSIDYKLIPAIAMQESTLCKKIPKDSHNCWGFGIYGSKITRFDTYEQAIETVTKTLARDYVSKGLTTPEAIMSKYTPSSNGVWADSVSLMMDKIHASL